MSKSSIEWTERTWNPVTGCTHVSPGCDHCYAEAMTKRFRRHEFTDVQLHPGRLEEPLHVKEPSVFFTCSMGDLFHERVPLLFIAQAFEIMAATPQHTYQVLTKRPGRMAYFATKHQWPDNVWAGTSVESQKYAPRIDVLARVPAPVRFVSAEPLLGPLDLARWLKATRFLHDENRYEPFPLLDWVIVGGESGQKARPFDIGWATDIVRQCDEARVPAFVKQLGRRPYGIGNDRARHWIPLADSHGGDMEEWPPACHDLRIRQMPRTAVPA